VPRAPATPNAPPIQPSSTPATPRTATALAELPEEAEIGRSAPHAPVLARRTGTGLVELAGLMEATQPARAGG
jgi:hypothetical protein